MIRFELKVDQSLEIECLTLSTRAMNILKRGKINTISDLVARWNDLNRIKGCGAGAIKEIRSALFNFNIETMANDGTLADFRVEVA